jgi:histidinol-phosphate phosphatase family protein
MRAIFLDRDGVICHNRPDHVKNWSEFVFLSRAREALARLATLEMPIIVVTNQAAINRGLVRAEQVDGIHRRMIAQVSAAGGRIDQVYYCPHRPDEHCCCRKPQPGMLFEAAADSGIELSDSYMVGDAWTDIQAGLLVGCTSFLVLTGRGLRQAPQAIHKGLGQFQIVRDLSEAVNKILQIEGRSIEEMTWSRSVNLATESRPQLFTGNLPPSVTKR